MSVLVDLHCHVHPGVDDGPTDEAESAALLRALADAGVRRLAATSHVRPDRGWMNTAPTEPERAARLERVRAAAGVVVEVVRGAEHYWHEEVFGDLDRFAELAVPFGTSRWVLVEAAYLGPPPGFAEVLFGLHRKGFRVLLAHVERFPYLEGDRALLDRLHGMGVRFQVNLGSLAGAHGRVQKHAAERVLKTGLVSVLAGDCHRASDVDANIVRGLAAARRVIDEATLRRLCLEGPSAILDDAPVERV